MKKLFGSFVYLLCIVSAFGQNITGLATDSNGEALVFANVLLNSANDSTMVRLEYTQDDGAFSFNNIEDDTYFVEIKYVGYEDYNSEIIHFNGSNIELGEIVLTPASTELSEVVVTAQRPLLEMKADRMVFNVDGSINAAGSDLLELLRKSPSVMVDNNENILMMGKSGVTILFDGKPSKLSGEELANYLKTIPSSEIDNIEIITNPSAKWDAEGNAGIINIRFKKDANLGANGSLTASFAQGHRSNYNLGVSGNYRNKKWNAYGNLGYNNGGGWNPLRIRSELFGNVYDQNSLGKGNWESQSLKLGVDHFISKKSTIGVLFNGYTNNGDWGSESQTDIYTLGAAVSDSILFANVSSVWEGLDWNTNVNYKYDDGGSRSLNIDLDYGFYDNQSLNTQPNQYVSGVDGTELRTTKYFTESPTTIAIKTAKADYEQELGKGRIELGLKVSEVSTENTFNFYRYTDAERVLDINNSNSFDYNEMVSAGYVNYSTQIEKFSVQVGLRGENTSSDGFLEAMVPTENERVKRSYFNIFPSGGLTYQMDEKNSFQVRYGRRLNRPNYQDLNPFRSQIDELTFEQGNPFLRPEYSHNVSLTHTWNYALNTTLSYTYKSDMIGQLTDALGFNTTIITRQNIDKQSNINLSISSPIPITDWWNSYTNINLGYLTNEGNLGDGKDIDISTFAGNLYSQHTFSLPKDYSLEVSGWGVTPSVWEGNFKMKGMYSIDVGIQKKFLENKLTVKLSGSDIFKTSNWEGESVLGALNVNANGGWDSRKAKISLSYNFGNDQVKSRQRSTGLEDEKSRIKSDNN